MSDHCLLGQEDCPACALLTPYQIQRLCVPVYKNYKDKPINLKTRERGQASMYTTDISPL